MSERTLGKRRNVFHANDRKSHIKPTEAVIEGIAYRRHTTIIEGMAGSGKSHVVTDLAATTAQSLRVLYITNESPEELDARLDAWGAFHRRGLPGLHILPEVAGLFDLSRVAALIESAKSLGGLDLIVHDILSNEFEGREESNENMAVAFQATQRVTRVCDCAYIISAHTGWSGEHIRGGSQAYGSARRVLQVENSDDVITLKVQKANVTRGMDSRRFRIVQVPLDAVPNADPKRAEEYTVLLPADSVLANVGPLSDRQLQILSCLALPIFSTSGAFPRDIIQHTKIPKSTINNATSVLLKRKLAEHHGKAKIIITEAGRVHWQALNDGAKLDRKPTEQATNAGSLNWVICSNEVQEINPLVRDGSYPVRSEFDASGSEFVRTLPSIEGTTTEQATTEPFEQPSGKGSDVVSNTVSVPYMITRDMRQRLRGFGETDAEIDRMTPQQAWALIEFFEMDGVGCA